MPDLSMDSLAQLLREVDGFISVDNFFPHFANFHKKSGVVLFGRSDPNIFGYPDNLNILKDRSLLRPQQFANWEDIEHTNDCFVPPKDVFRLIQGRYPEISSTMVLDLSQV
jgi:ADP-heptose:LPS heptosyltransferase